MTNDKELLAIPDSVRNQHNLNQELRQKVEALERQLAGSLRELEDRKEANVRMGNELFQRREDVVAQSRTIDTLRSSLECVTGERDEAKRIVNEIWEMFYGQNMRVENWHKNGDLEPIDSFFESNDWDIKPPSPPVQGAGR